jgi:flagellar biosynthesis protein FlhB
VWSRNVLGEGLVSYWLLSALAVVGVAVLRRSVPKLVALASFVATTVVAAAVTIGQTRYRAPADVTIVLLAAVAVDAFWQRVTTKRSASRDRVLDDL